MPLLDNARREMTGNEGESQRLNPLAAGASRDC